MDNINEWFHKNEVIQMLESFAMQVLATVGTPDDNTLLSEIYAEALYKYERITDCQEFKNIIHSFASYVADAQTEIEDHIEFNKEKFGNG